MTPSSGLPAELWIHVIHAARPPITSHVSILSRSDGPLSSLRSLASVSQLFRAIGQPLLYETLSIGHKSDYDEEKIWERLKGIASLLESRPESQTWTKMLQLQCPVDPSEMLPAVAKLFLQMTSLQHIDIRGFTLSCAMFHHIFRLQQLQSLAYSPAGGPVHFDAAKVNPNDLTIKKLCIPHREREDLFLLTRAPGLKDMEMWAVPPITPPEVHSPQHAYVNGCVGAVRCEWRGNGQLRIAANEIAPVVDPTTTQPEPFLHLTRLSTIVPSSTRVEPFLKFLGLYPSIAKLELSAPPTLQEPPPFDRTFLSGFLPALKIFTGPISWAVKLVPGRPLEELTLSRDYMVLENSHLSLLHGGTGVITKLYFTNLRWREGMVTEITSLFPELVGLHLAFATIADDDEVSKMSRWPY